MAITTTPSSVTFHGNGSTTVFTFTFVGDDDSDLEVLYTDTAGNVSTLNPSTYSITINAAATGALWGIGGTLTYPLTGSAIASGTSVTLNRIVPYVQDVSINNQGAFYPTAIEQGLDKLELQIQQLKTLDAQAIKIPVVDVGVTNNILPAAAGRASKYFHFDSSGVPEMVTTAPSVGSSPIVMVTTIAALKAVVAATLAVSPLYYVKGYSTEDDGGQGLFLHTTSNPGADNGGTIIWSNTSGHYFVRQVAGNEYPNTHTGETAYLDVKWFGAKGDRSTDDTAAITAALAAGPNVYFSPGIYAVSQIVMTGLGLNIWFEGSQLLGTSGSAKTSVLDIKCGHSVLRNIEVNGNFNLNYQSVVHWYTNDLNLYYPGQNRIDGLKVVQGKIGLCVGALPSQSDPIPAQNTVQAAGIATDAPLSESVVIDLHSVDCIRSLYFRQPNGKVTFVSPCLTGQDVDFSAYSPKSDTRALVIVGEGSEVSILGGNIEQTQTTQAYLWEVNDGTLNIVGTVMETNVPAYMSGTAQVRIVGALDFGLNMTGHLFHVDTLSSNSLIIENCRIVGLAGGGSAGSTNGGVIKAINGLGGSFAPNYSGFRAILSNVEIRDFPFTGVADGYLPLTYGVFCQFNDCYWTNYNTASPPVRTRYQKVDNGNSNKLAGVIDTPATIITAYGVNGNAASGGWTFAVGGASSWGSGTTSMPTIEGYLPSKYLRLTGAGGGGTVSATTAKFNITPQQTVIMEGIVKGGNTSAGIAVKFFWYKYDNSASATASTDVLVGGESLYTTGWQQLLLHAIPPPDATQMTVQLYAENGATCYYINPSIHQTEQF